MRRRDRSLARAPVSFRALIVLVSAVVFVDTVFFTAITPLLPHYVRVLHLGKSGAGLLVAAYAIGTMLGSIPGGVVASRFGVRTAVVAGMTFMSVATLTFGFAHTAAVLDGARFVQGVGGACTWAGGLAWVASEAPPDRRAGALGIAFAAAVSGSLCGPVVGAIASGVGTGPAFAGATVAGATLVAVSFLVPAPRRAAPQSLTSALSALGDVRLVAGMWLTALAGLAAGVVDVLVPLRLSRLGGGAVLIGAAFLGSAAVEAALAPVVGRLADSRGRLVPVRVSVALAVPVSLLLPFVSPAGVLFAVVVLGFPAYGTLFPPASALISDGAARRGLHQGLAFGLANLSWASGQAVAAAGAGALAEATTDAVPYGMLVAAFVLTLVVVSRRRPPVWHHRPALRLRAVEAPRKESP